MLRDRGARPHPGSGSGRIANDGSTDVEVIEVKSAHRQITLNGQKLRHDWRRALHIGRDWVMVIRFGEAEIEAEVRIRSSR